MKLSASFVLPLCFSIAWIAVLPTIVVRAQDPGGLEIAEITGKLQAVAGYQIKLKAEDGTDYMAVVSPGETTFRYRGTADIKFLSPGLLIRFTAPFDQGGNTPNPIAQIEVFNPVRQKRMRADQLQEQTPGIYPAKKNEKEEAPPAGFENIRVVGKLMGAQGDRMQVAAGNRPVVVPFDPAMEILVSSGDATFCMEGDEITVTGLRNPSQVNWIKAETIIVTGAKPLAPPEKKARASRADRKRTKPGEAEKPATGDKK